MSRNRRNRRARGNRGAQTSRRRQSGKRPNKARRITKKIFTNRRNPNSCWLTLDDVVKNVKEGWYSFWNSVPRGERFYWKKGKIVGNSTRNTWPS